MEKNKTGKYLKYAIGEIVLVVIGILIALQVSSWNQKRLINKQEYKLISELKNDLIGTQNELKIDIENLNMIVELSDSIISYLDTIDSKEYDASVFGTDIGIALVNVKLYPRTIAYENLKSLGVELISNDSIRYHLTDLFDRRLPRISLWEGIALENERELYNKLDSHFKATPTDHEWFSYFLIPNEFDRNSKKLFINRLVILQNNRHMINYLYTNLLDQITMVLEMLEKEY